MDPPPGKRRRRGSIKLNEDKLPNTLEAAISSQGNAELAILYLINCYDINLEDVRRILLEKGLNVSFSKVKYSDMAPRVGLEPTLTGNDIPKFDIHRARIPTPLFKDIIKDLDIIMKQYGEPRDHGNEEARSRFLAPLFNRTIALFKLAIRNIPESVIPGRMTTKGRIEYHFLIFGGISVLVIEVKYVLGVAEERLNAIAQVIAECDACDYANDGLGFPPFPIYGILCDGTSFEFFSFSGSTTPPTFSRGVFHSPGLNPYDVLTIANFRGTSKINFICSLRPICETLFYFLLLAYKTGIHAYTSRSVSNGKTERRAQESTPGWKEAEEHAHQALALAVDAAEKESAHDPSADDIVDNAVEQLEQSLAALPASYKRDVDLIGFWDDDAVRFC